MKKIISTILICAVLITCKISACATLVVGAFQSPEQLGDQKGSTKSTEHVTPPTPAPSPKSSPEVKKTTEDNSSKSEIQLEKHDRILDNDQEIVSRIVETCERKGTSEYNDFRYAGDLVGIKVSKISSYAIPELNRETGNFACCVYVRYNLNGYTHHSYESYIGYVEDGEIEIDSHFEVKDYDDFYANSTVKRIIEQK